MFTFHTTNPLIRNAKRPTQMVPKYTNLFRILQFLLLSTFLSFTNNNVKVILSLTSPQDIKALKAFKDSIKPSSIPHWSCLGSWDFTSKTVDPCALPHRIKFICGFTCSPDSTRVTQLTLDPMGYSGTLTPLISLLTSLTVLDLSNNNFYGTIPPSLFSLTNLEILVLPSNSLSGSISASIGNLKSLQSLDLSHNYFTGYLPKTLDSMSSLQRLDLSYNKLSGSLPKLPSSLQELALRANSFSGSLQKATFDGLNRLAVIELSMNMFCGTLESWFFLLPSLQQVDLDNNNLTRVDVPQPTHGTSQLVAIQLGFNKIEGTLPVDFASYPILSSLSMRHNALRGSIPLEYSQKKNLVRLFLDGNFLIGKPPAGFFTGDGIAGSLGDNCLQECPGSSSLCSPAQKSSFVCKQVYGSKGRPKSF